MTLSDFRHRRRLTATLRPLFSPSDGSPPIARTTFPTCRAHYPGGSSRCACRLLPCLCSLPQMAGRSASALVTFQACSGFTRVTARRIAQPPKVTFVTRLQPCQLPSRAACQPYRQLSRWNHPQLMIRVFGAHSQRRHRTAGATSHALERRAWRLRRRRYFSPGNVLCLRPSYGCPSALQRGQPPTSLRQTRARPSMAFAAQPTLSVGVA